MVKVAHKLVRRQIDFRIAQARYIVFERLKAAGVVDTMGADKFYLDLKDAVSAAEAYLATQQLATTAASIAAPGVCTALTLTPLHRLTVTLGWYAVTCSA